MTAVSTWERHAGSAPWLPLGSVVRECRAGGVWSGPGLSASGGSGWRDLLAACPARPCAPLRCSSPVSSPRAGASTGRNPWPTALQDQDQGCARWREPGRQRWRERRRPSALTRLRSWSRNPPPLLRSSPAARSRGLRCRVVRRPRPVPDRGDRAWPRRRPQSRGPPPVHPARTVLVAHRRARRRRALCTAARSPRRWTVCRCAASARSRARRWCPRGVSSNPSRSRSDASGMPSRVDSTAERSLPAICRSPDRSAAVTARRSRSPCGTRIGCFPDPDVRGVGWSRRGSSRGVLMRRLRRVPSTSGSWRRG